MAYQGGWGPPQGYAYPPPGQPNGPPFVPHFPPPGPPPQGYGPPPPMPGPPPPPHLVSGAAGFGGPAFLGPVITLPSSAASPLPYSAAQPPPTSSSYAAVAAGHPPPHRSMATGHPPPPGTADEVRREGMRVVRRKKSSTFQQQRICTQSDLTALMGRIQTLASQGHGSQPASTAPTNTTAHHQHASTTVPSASSAPATNGAPSDGGGKQTTAAALDILRDLLDVTKASSSGPNKAFDRPEPGSGLPANMVAEERRFGVSETGTFLGGAPAPTAPAGSASWDRRSDVSMDLATSSASSAAAKQLEADASAAAAAGRASQLEKIEASLGDLKAKIATTEGEAEQLSKRESLLEKNAAALRKQHNQLLREAQRRGRRAEEDPLIAENVALQDSVAEGLSQVQADQTALRATVAQLVQTHGQLKAAKARLKAEGKEAKGDSPQPSAARRKKEKRKKDKRRSPSSSPDPPEPPVKRKDKRVDRKVAEEAEVKVLKDTKTAEEVKDPTHYQYYDGGHHFCLHCGTHHRTLMDFLPHLHSDRHLAAIASQDFPWTKPGEGEPSLPPPGAPVVSERLRGVEQLTPALAYFCRLCGSFAGDPASAQAHLASQAHGAAYRRLLADQPHYQKMLDERIARLGSGAGVSGSQPPPAPAPALPVPAAPPRPTQPLLPSPRLAEPAEPNKPTENAAPEAPDGPFGRFDPGRRVLSDHGGQIQIEVGNAQKRREALPPTKSFSSLAEMRETLGAAQRRIAEGLGLKHLASVTDLNTDEALLGPVKETRERSPPFGGRGGRVGFRGRGDLPPRGFARGAFRPAFASPERGRNAFGRHSPPPRSRRERSRSPRKARSRSGSRERRSRSRDKRSRSREKRSGSRERSSGSRRRRRRSPSPGVTRAKSPKTSKPPSSRWDEASSAAVVDEVELAKAQARKLAGRATEADHRLFALHKEKRERQRREAQEKEKHKEKEKDKEKDKGSSMPEVHKASDKPQAGGTRIMRGEELASAAAEVVRGLSGVTDAEDPVLDLFGGWDPSQLQRRDERDD